MYIFAIVESNIITTETNETYMRYLASYITKLASYTQKLSKRFNSRRNIPQSKNDFNNDTSTTTVGGQEEKA